MVLRIWNILKIVWKDLISVFFLHVGKFFVCKFGQIQPPQCFLYLFKISYLYFLSSDKAFCVISAFE
jgi:hypothetical protein